MLSIVLQDLGGISIRLPETGKGVIAAFFHTPQASQPNQNRDSPQKNQYKLFINNEGIPMFSNCKDDKK